MRLFCTDCGEIMEVRRWYLLLYGYARCRNCAKLPFPKQLLTLLLLTLSGFYLGSLTHPPCLKTAAVSPRTIVSKPVVRAEAEKECGARTRSGRACRRKVKGEKYCWQHKYMESSK